MPTRLITWLILGGCILTIIVATAGCTQSPAAQCYTQGFRPGTHTHTLCMEGLTS